MSKYIDAEKLVAEIERLLARANRRTDKEHLSHNSEMEKFGEDYWNGYGDLAYSLLGYVDSIQQEQPEVELGKLGEIARHIIAVKQNVEDMRLSEDEWSLLEKIGYPQKLNARKEETK